MTKTPEELKSKYNPTGSLTIEEVIEGITIQFMADHRELMREEMVLFQNMNKCLLEAHEEMAPAYQAENV